MTAKAPYTRSTVRGAPPHRRNAAEVPELISIQAWSILAARASSTWHSVVCIQVKAGGHLSPRGCFLWGGGVYSNCIGQAGGLMERKMVECNFCRLPSGFSPFPWPPRHLQFPLFTLPSAHYLHLQCFPTARYLHPRLQVRQPTHCQIPGFPCQHASLPTARYRVFHASTPAYPLPDTGFSMPAHQPTHCQIPGFPCQHASLLTARYRVFHASTPAYPLPDTGFSMPARQPTHCQIPGFPCQHASLPTARYQVFHSQQVPTARYRIFHCQPIHCQIPGFPCRHASLLPAAKRLVFQLQTAVVPPPSIPTASELSDSCLVAYNGPVWSVTFQQGSGRQQRSAGQPLYTGVVTGARKGVGGC